MKRYRQELQELLSALSEIESTWMEAEDQIASGQLPAGPTPWAWCMRTSNALLIVNPEHPILAGGLLK